MITKIIVQHGCAYSVNLKKQFINKVIFNDTAYHQIITKRRQPLYKTAFTHIMWDESGTIDGARVSFGLTKNDKTLDLGDTCEFKIYTVSNDGTPWVNTVIKTGSLTPATDKLFKTTLTATEIGESPIGDITILIEAKITRGLDSFQVRKYFNHIGITDFTQLLKRKINFIEIVN